MKAIQYIRQSYPTYNQLCDCCETNESVHTIKFILEDHEMTHCHFTRHMYFCDMCFSLAELSCDYIRDYKSMNSEMFAGKAYDVLMHMIGKTENG